MSRMINKTVLLRCRCHLRATAAGRRCQNLTAFARDKSFDYATHHSPAVAIIRNVTRRTFAAKTDEPREENVGYSAEMAPHIRTCRSRRDEDARTEKKERDTGFIVSFLGTGGGMPTMHRITSATLLRLGGLSFLFDAGEGLQRQLTFSSVSVGQIAKIFITHLHGDHLFGLPGLLLHLRIAALSSQNNSHVIEIYGPPGLHTYVAANLALSCTAFAGVRVVVYELMGGQAEGGPRGHYWGGQSKNNIFLDSYPELASQWLIRKTIDRNEDGTWTIDNPENITVHKDDDEKVRGSNEVNAGSLRRLHIAAAEVTHIQGVQTFGFVVQELEPPRKIDAAKATALGVRPSRKYQLLKNGFPVVSDDGTHKVQPDSVLLDATTKARKFALIGDNCGVSPEMVTLCKDADVLVHEATISEGRASVGITYVEPIPTHGSFSVHSSDGRQSGTDRFPYSIFFPSLSLCIPDRRPSFEDIRRQRQRESLQSQSRPKF